MISVVYFGTNEFSGNVLGTLAREPDFTIKAVVTQPDRPVGRKQTLAPTPVKLVADSLGLPVFNPASLKQFPPGTLPPADIFVVFAYGLLIPQIILDLPKHGTLNVHPSLLPKYRGPTPVQSALIHGETETGVSIMLLDAEMDHGPILSQTKLPIDPQDVAESLTKKLITNVAPILLKVIRDWTDKKIAAKEQNHAEATYCKIFSREDGQVDFAKPAQEIYDLYRGLTPWPGVWTTWQGKRLKLLGFKPDSIKIPPGVARLEGAELFIGTANGSLKILELQMEGKTAQDSASFINGHQDFLSATLPS